MACLGNSDHSNKVLGTLIDLSILENTTSLFITLLHTTHILVEFHVKIKVINHSIRLPNIRIEQTVGSDLAKTRAPPNRDVSHQTDHQSKISIFSSMKKLNKNNKK